MSDCEHDFRSTQGTVKYCPKCNLTSSEILREQIMRLKEEKEKVALCPFCGAHKRCYTHMVHPLLLQVKCMECYSSGPVSTSFEEALLKWNKRCAASPETSEPPSFDAALAKAWEEYVSIVTINSSWNPRNKDFDAGFRAGVDAARGKA